MNTEPRKDEHYYIDFATFEVEDVLFRVPRCLLENCMSLGPDENAPVKLHDITAYDFRNLMIILLPLDQGFKMKAFSKEDWMSVLTLSMKWRLYSAIGKINRFLITSNITSVDKIEIGRKCNVRVIFRQGCLELIKRDDFLSVEEVEQLGYRLGFNLMSLRDRAQLEGCDETEDFDGGGEMDLNDVIFPYLNQFTDDWWRMEH